MMAHLTPALVVEAGYTGEIPLVEQASADPDPTLRSAALGSFLRLGELSISRLLRALNDPDPGVRRRAAELSHRTDLSDADRANTLVPELVARLDDEPSIVEVAAFALGELGDLQAANELGRTALEHDDALCRESAVAALGSLHTGLEVILAAMNDKATVRRRAVIALSPFDGPAVEAALRTALDDRDWQVRQAAEDQLPSASDGATGDGAAESD